MSGISKKLISTNNNYEVTLTMKIPSVRLMYFVFMYVFIQLFVLVLVIRYNIRRRWVRQRPVFRGG